MCFKWMSPFLKQCFVTTGVSLNYMAHGLVMGFTSVLIPALRTSTEIPVDHSTATWIASIFGVSHIFGALTVPSVITRFGRKPANAFSAALMTLGWVTIAVSTSASHLLLGRFLQGYSMGFLAIIGSILIGEYTSPTNRGPLLATISLLLMLGIMLSHALGTFLSWKTLAGIFAAISFVDVLIILYSPESPSFLATRGRYDECRRVFHWLRGHDENDELEKLIKADMTSKRNKVVNNDQGFFRKVTNNIKYIKATFSKKEVYKSMLITMHLNAMNLWSGGITFDAYAKDIIEAVVGKDVSFALVVVSLDVQRLISIIAAVFVVKRLRRRFVLGVSMWIDLFGLLAIALYIYLKIHNIISFDYPLVGIVLLHILMFSVSAGLMILATTVPGEIFPLEHRGLCGMMGILCFSVNEIINIKSAPYLFSSIGVHGAYIMYAGLVIYFFSVTWFLLPETKDRTLLDIEEEFRGEPLLKQDNLVTSCKVQEKRELDENP